VTQKGCWYCIARRKLGMRLHRFAKTMEVIFLKIIRLPWLVNLSYFKA